MLSMLRLDKVLFQLLRGFGYQHLHDTVKT